jgi:hypothetical protein
MKSINIVSVQHKDDPLFAEFLETHGKSVNELIDDEEESDKEPIQKDEESDSEEGKEANKEISDLDVKIHNLSL